MSTPKVPSALISIKVSSLLTEKTGKKRYEVGGVAGFGVSSRGHSSPGVPLSFRLLLSMT